MGRVDGCKNSSLFNAYSYADLPIQHHCPWIGGCVGFKNYKPFILFLLYADLVALWTASSSIWTIIQVLDVDIEVRHLTLHQFEDQTGKSGFVLDLGPSACSMGIPGPLWLSLRHDAHRLLSLPRLSRREQSHDDREHGTEWPVAVPAGKS